MLTAFLSALLVSWSPASSMCVPVSEATNGPAMGFAAVPEDNHEALYAEGITFQEFLDAADRRREAWHDHYREGTVPVAVLERARAVGGSWYILAVAEDWCGDSVNTIPYIARLVEAVDGVELRVVNSTVGRSIMEAHRTPDGRAATPTVLLLDDNFEEVGCFVERPTALQSWFLENESKLDESDLYEQKYAWYDRDQGAETVREVVELMEAAQGGAPLCAASN